MKLKEITTALCDWAEQDNEHRSVVCIAIEKINDTEEGYTLSTSTAINCKTQPMAQAIVDIMQEEEKLADLITKVFITYALEQDPCRNRCNHSQRKGGQR